MKLLVTVLIVGVMMTSTYSQGVQETLEKVKAGVEAGKAIVDILTAQKESKHLGKIAEVVGKVAPFLGAIGPAIQLATVLLPKAPSEELVLMKKEFANIDANFDHVFDLFEEVKNLMKEESLKAQYSSYAIDIDVLSKRLGAMFDRPVSETTTHKKRFIDLYENTDGKATDAFILGMMGGSEVYDNIPLAAIEFTDNHRRRTIELMTGVVGLIMKGMKVDLAYHKLKGNKQTYDNLKSYFQEEIQKVINVVVEMERKVIGEWFTELSGDIDSKLASLHDKNNEEFANEMYAHLVDKYDWRDWHVVAYNELHGGDKHWVKWCGGYHRFREHNRNLVVASVDQSKSPIDKEKASKVLTDAKTEKCKKILWVKKCRALPANEVYELLPAELTDGCTYASVGVIEGNAGIAHNAPDHRLVTIDNKKFKLHTFG